MGAGAGLPWQPSEPCGLDKHVAVAFTPVTLHITRPWKMPRAVCQPQRCQGPVLSFVRLFVRFAPPVLLSRGVFLQCAWCRRRRRRGGVLLMLLRRRSRARAVSKGSGRYGNATMLECCTEVGVHLFRPLTITSIHIHTNLNVPPSGKLHPLLLYPPPFSFLL